VRRSWIALVGLAFFQGLTAIAGGVGLVAGWITPGEDLLEGSPFDGYVVPGAALLGVGVLTTVAAIAAERRQPFAAPLAGLAGVAMIVFELVEVAVIGFNALQVVYGIAGLLLVALAARLWRAGATGSVVPRSRVPASEASPTS
jgi:hypothetical protein